MDGSFFDNVDNNLNEVRAVAREIVREENEKHAGAGLGRVDYALVADESFVTKHSQAASVGGESVWFLRIRHNGVHADSVKTSRPSFGEPGDSFTLNGTFITRTRLKMSKLDTCPSVELCIPCPSVRHGY